MSEKVRKAPALPVTDSIGPRQRELENKKQEKKMHNKAKALGVLSLYIKISFLLAGVTLWQMPWVKTLFMEIPLHQIVAATTFAVIVYMELKPYFANRSTEAVAKKSKAKKSGKSNMEEAGLSLIEE